MKSIFTNKIKFLGAFILASGLTFGQTVADKRVQAGLTGNFGLNMVKMGTSKMQSNGIGSNLSIGINLHTTFKNSKNLGIASGVEFDFGTLKYKPTDATYYEYNDTDILSKKDASDATGTFLINERTQKPVFITVPVMFLFRTDFIGDFRYFGKFGVRNSFLVSQKINDSGIDFANSNPSITGVVKENVNMKAPGEMFFYNGSVGMFAGAEWNFVGSTCLVAEVGYFYGITPLYLNRNEDKKSIYNTSPSLSNPKVYYSNKANLNQLMLKISILF
jgi:hypothetical protein